MSSCSCQVSPRTSSTNCTSVFVLSLQHHSCLEFKFQRRRRRHSGWFSVIVCRRLPCLRCCSHVPLRVQRYSTTCTKLRTEKQATWAARLDHPSKSNQRPRNGSPTCIARSTELLVLQCQSPGPAAIAGLQIQRLSTGMLIYLLAGRYHTCSTSGSTYLLDPEHK